MSQKEGHADELFNSCNAFSLAFDTGLFGQEDVLAATVRFSLENKIVQFPLFFSVCLAKTGEEMASFIFYQLRRKNVPFAKLCSIATDGAASMIGDENGMVALLERKIQGHCRDFSLRISNVWCLSHRLNLVVGDMNKMDHVQSVFNFADWITKKGGLRPTQDGSTSPSQPHTSKKSPNHPKPDGPSTKTWLPQSCLNRNLLKCF